MKLKLYTLLTFSLLSLTSLAQVTLNKADLTPSAGDTVRMVVATYMAPGNGGANVTWDFSSLDSTGSSVLKFVTTTIWNDSFSSTPSHIADQESLYFEFYSMDADSLVIMGSVTDYDTDTVVQVMSDPVKQLVFPLTYNTGFTDNYYADYDYLGINVISSGEVTGTVDGYGTLKLPWGDVNDALRIKFVDSRIDSYDIGFGLEQNHVITTRYTWYKAGNPNPVLNLVSIATTQNTQEAASYIDEHSYNNVGISKITLDANLSIYPNPVKNTEILNIDLISDNQINIDEVEITDVTGKVVMSKEIINNTSQNLKLDIYSLTKGLYFVTIKSGNASVTKKFTVY